MPEIPEEQEYTLRPLTPEEEEALSKDMQEVLAKHNAELGVRAILTLTKRVTKDEETKSETHSEAEESSTSSGEEPTE